MLAILEHFDPVLAHFRARPDLSSSWNLVYSLGVQIAKGVRNNFVGAYQLIGEAGRMR